ncbi:uncharacterized protein [Diadema setosum]|uniref:uncharacterized protein n=1 Tax=Diadema setosum TaxID=31175 RepID=UPI003B3AF59A
MHTDHGSLTWLMNFKEPQGQLAHWLEELSQYDMKVEHQPGTKHQNADALSRMPRGDFLCENYRLGMEPDDLPCGGCSYCRKAHNNWSLFADVIDDVVPLAQRNNISEITVDQSVEGNLLVTHLDIDCQEGSPSLSINGVAADETAPSCSVDLDLTDFLRKEQGADAQLSLLRRWSISRGVCTTCNRSKKTVRYGRHPLINYHAGAPMERVRLDFIGPLPKTTQGNEYILMMVDQFTKWIECVPLPSQTAEVTAQAAVKGEY